MLRDLFFYPLAILIVAGIIAAALTFDAQETLTDEEIMAQGYKLEGEPLLQLVAAPATNYEYVAPASNDVAFVKMWTDIARNNIGGSAGVFAPLSSDYERVFGGKTLRMTIIARQNKDNPLSEFDMGYFTASVGDSGWQRRILSKDWQAYSFTFAPNPPKGDPDIDYFGIWPGEAGSGQMMDVAKMQIDILPE